MICHSSCSFASTSNLRQNLGCWLVRRVHHKLWEPQGFNRLGGWGRPSSQVTCVAIILSYVFLGIAFFQKKNVVHHPSLWSFGLEKVHHRHCICRLWGMPPAPEISHIGNQSHRFVVPETLFHEVQIPLRPKHLSVAWTQEHPPKAATRSVHSSWHLLQWLNGSWVEVWYEFPTSGSSISASSKACFTSSCQE